jgi:gentisate 1,2-dioxygenase
VFKGEGYSIIDGQRFDWTEGDFLVIPSWAWHEHAAAEGKETILFSIQDTPIMKSMALYREEPYVENGGNQPVTSRFQVGSSA